jgi:hypothetical protein
VLIRYHTHSAGEEIVRLAARATGQPLNVPPGSSAETQSIPSPKFCLAGVFRSSNKFVLFFHQASQTYQLLLLRYPKQHLLFLLRSGFVLPELEIVGSHGYAAARSQVYQQSLATRPLDQTVWSWPISHQRESRAEGSKSKTEKISPDSGR